jgi:signal peptide peptidase SppA
MDSINLSRESIFISAIRAFCNAFFAILGVTICVFLIGVILALVLGSSSTTEKTLFSIQPDAQGNRTPLPLSSPALLKISIDGIIGTGKLTTSSIENLLLDSREGILKHDRVKGILLYINTPGGSVTDTNGIYEAIKAYKDRYKIPIFAYVDGTCASGGFYIAATADKIYSSSVSIIGSVGITLGPIFNFYGLMEKWGVKATTISTGKDKNLLNPFAPLKPDEESSLSNISKSLYELFVNIVTTARPRLDKQKLIDVYGAQVFVASTAETLGFIDVANTNYEHTIQALAEAAGIKKEEKYQVIECKVQRPFFSDFLDSKHSLPSLKFIEKIFSSEKGGVSELKDPFLYLYQPSAT